MHGLNNFILELHSEKHTIWGIMGRPKYGHKVQWTLHYRQGKYMYLRVRRHVYVTAPAAIIPKIATAIDIPLTTPGEYWQSHSHGWPEHFWSINIDNDMTIHDNSHVFTDFMCYLIAQELGIRIHVRTWYTPQPICALNNSPFQYPSHCLVIFIAYN